MAKEKIIIAEGRTLNHVTKNVYFDAEAHQYFHVLKSGALLEIPGVSAILQASGMKPDNSIPRRIMERAMNRGSAVHRACHLDVIGELDEKNLSEEVKPYWAAFRKWRIEKVPVIVASEVPMYDPIFDVCGTADIIAELIPGKMETVIDIKSGLPDSWHVLQFAGYGIIRYGKDWLKHGLGGLYLSKNGNYNFQPVSITHQIAAGAEWLRMVKSYHAKRNSLFVED